MAIRTVYTFFAIFILSINVHSQDTSVCQVNAPNAISPDSAMDGKILFLPEIDCEIKSYSLSVYDRWGEELFSSKKENEAWDATKAASGVYVYLLKLKSKEGDEYTRKGSVVVLR